MQNPDDSKKPLIKTLITKAFDNNEFIWSTFSFRSSNDLPKKLNHLIFYLKKSIKFFSIRWLFRFKLIIDIKIFNCLQINANFPSFFILNVSSFISLRIKSEVKATKTPIDVRVIPQYKPTKTVNKMWNLLSLKSRIIEFESLKE